MTILFGMEYSCKGVVRNDLRNVSFKALNIDEPYSNE